MTLICCWYIEDGLIYCTYLVSHFHTMDNVCHCRFGVLQTVNLKPSMLATLPTWILWLFHLMVPFVLLEGRYVPLILHVLFNRLLKHFGHMNLLSMAWDCRVSTVNRLQGGQAKNYGLIPGMDSPPNCQDWFLAHQSYSVGFNCI